MRTFIALTLVLLAQTAAAQDPTHTDGDKYKVLLDNERVRVLAYQDQPGDRTHMHAHPGFVLYALAPFKRKLTLADGKTMLREFKAGDVVYSPEQAHIGENVGQTPTQVIMVELKPSPPSVAAKN